MYAGVINGDASNFAHENFLIQLAIFAPLYALSAWATIWPTKTSLGSSKSKFFKCERDEALVINGFFLIGVSILAMANSRAYSASHVIWLFAMPIAILEFQFRAKNQLDKRWKYIFEFFAVLPLALEVFF